MKYVLITSTGRQYVYHVKACAELFRGIFGGHIHIVDKETISSL